MVPSWKSSIRLCLPFGQDFNLLRCFSWLWRRFPVSLNVVFGQDYAWGVPQCSPDESEAGRQWVIFSMPDGSRCSSTLRNKESALLPMSPGRVLNADIEMPDKRLMSSRALWGSWTWRSFCFPFLVGMEKAMAPHSSTLAWKIPWTEEPGRLQSMGSRRVRHDWATSLSLFTVMHWRRKWQPTPVFLPGESQGWWAGGLPSMGSHRVRHDWSDLAAAAYALIYIFLFLTYFTLYNRV